jgi:hypothetical protein
MYFDGYCLIPAAFMSFLGLIPVSRSPKVTW